MGYSRYIRTLKIDSNELAWDLRNFITVLKERLAQILGKCDGSNGTNERLENDDIGPGHHESTERTELLHPRLAPPEGVSLLDVDVCAS